MKIDSEFLSIKFLAVRNQIGFFDFVLLAQGVVFEDPPCKNTICGAWAALERVGAMPLLYRVDWQRGDAIFEEIAPIISDKKTNWIILD